MADTDNGDMVIEMDLLPPRWLDIQDEVSDILAKIATQTSALEQLHQKHVLPGFDDEDVKRREEREIERLTQDITRGFQLCQKAIGRIDSMVKESKDAGGISNAEEKMAKNLKINLATRVGDASALFRKKQSAYLKSMAHFSFLNTLIILTSPHRAPSARWLLLPARPLVYTSKHSKPLRHAVTTRLRSRRLLLLRHTPASAPAAIPGPRGPRHRNSRA